MKKRKFEIFFKSALLTSLASALLTSVALADWRSDLGVFRVGVAAQYGEPFKRQRYESFRLALSKALNMPVELFQARDSSALIDAIASSRIEYAVVSALGYATLDEFCSCVTPLVAPISEDGAQAVRAILYVNPAKITSLDQLSGAKVAVGPPTSLTGNIIPLAQFKVGGSDLEELGAQIIVADDTEQGMKSFMAGDVDAFFGWQATADDNAKEFVTLMTRQLDAFPQEAVSVAWRSNPIRFGPHVLRNNLPAEVSDRLRQTLVNMNAQAPLAYDAIAPDLAGGFQTVSKSDYASALRLVRDLKENR